MDPRFTDCVIEMGPDREGFELFQAGDYGAGVRLDMSVSGDMEPTELTRRIVEAIRGYSREVYGQPAKLFNCEVDDKTFDPGFEGHTAQVRYLEELHENEQVNIIDAVEYLRTDMGLDREAVRNAIVAWIYYYWDGYSSGSA